MKLNIEIGESQLSELPTNELYSLLDLIVKEIGLRLKIQAIESKSMKESQLDKNIMLCNNPIADSIEKVGSIDYNPKTEHKPKTGPGKGGLFKWTEKENQIILSGKKNKELVELLPGRTMSGICVQKCMLKKAGRTSGDHVENIEKVENKSEPKKDMIQVLRFVPIKNGQGGVKYNKKMKIKIERKDRKAGDIIIGDGDSKIEVDCDTNQ